MQFDCSPQRMGNIRPIPYPDFWVPNPVFRVSYPDFRVCFKGIMPWFQGDIPWFQGTIWRDHTLKSGYGTGKQILKITVLRPFLNQFIIRIYHFELNMLTHLNFCDPTIKFFLDHPKNLHWNIELDNLVGVGGWVFPGHPLKFSPFC